jgi:hypothetical protein
MPNEQHYQQKIRKSGGLNVRFGLSFYVEHHYNCNLLTTSNIDEELIPRLYHLSKLKKIP